MEDMQSLSTEKGRAPRMGRAHIFGGAPAEPTMKQLGEDARGIFHCAGGGDVHSSGLLVCGLAGLADQLVVEPLQSQRIVSPRRYGARFPSADPRLWNMSAAGDLSLGQAAGPQRDDDVVDGRHDGSLCDVA